MTAETRADGPPEADPAGEDSWAPGGRGMLRDQAYVQLRRSILSGHLTLGQSLSVRALSEMIGASVMPTRDALHRLVVEGAMEPLPNGRARVPLITRAEFDELIALRRLLEPFACARACEAGPPAGFAASARTLMERRGAASVPDPEATLWMNYRLHFSIYAASGSRHLVELIDSVWLRYGPMLIAPMSEEASARAYRIDMASLETRLVEAVVVRDAEYAASLMRTIIGRTADWYAENFSFPG